MPSLQLQSDIDASYRILELEPGSPAALVEQSWRKLVDEWRPDRFGDDKVLQARAITRVGALNQAYQVLTAHLAAAGPAVAASSVQMSDVEAPVTGSRLRRPVMVSTAFAGLALAAVLIARPSSTQKPKPMEILDTPAPARSLEVQSPTTSAPELRLISRGAVTVSATLVADGRILLPETLLQPGQVATLPRLGPTYLKYSAGENLEIEFAGNRYALPDAGPNRAKIN